MIKSFFTNVGEFLLIVICSPFLLLMFIFWVIPVVMVESLREKRLAKVQAKREELEQLSRIEARMKVIRDFKDRRDKVYDKMCRCCPNAKECHENCETCDEYEEAVAHENL